MNAGIDEGPEVRLDGRSVECSSLRRVRRHTRVRVLLAVLILCVLVLVSGGGGSPSQATSSSPPSEVLYSEDFEDGQAQGWDLLSDWHVVSAGSDGSYLRCAGSGVGALLEDSWGDFAFSVRVRPGRGAVHLIYRTGSCVRYFIGFSEGNLTLNRTNPCGTHKELATKSGSWKTKHWYEIRIAGVGSAITISVDGVTRLSYTDREPLLYGGIALEVVEDAGEAWFDDIRVIGQRPPDPGLTWVRTGGPLGGLGYDIRMSPDNPDLLYVTDTSGGLHISRDGGDTWVPSNEGITTRAGGSGDGIPVFCVTVDAHDSSIVWLGTQNKRGIYRSTDGGRTWAERDTGVVETEGISFRGFTVDPRSSDIVYAAAEISSYAWAGTPLIGKGFDLTKGVVYKTTDGGEHWRAAWRGNSLARYIWIDPSSPDTVYVSTGIFDREAADADTAHGNPGGVGVLKSTDGGIHWRELGTANGLANLYIGSLFMHTRDSKILLAAAGSNVWRDRNGVYLSEDGGETWQAVLVVHEECFTAVEFAVSDPAVAYAGSELGFYRSADEGHSWEPVGNRAPWGPPGIRIGVPIDIQVDPRDADRVFVNAYGGGNFLSTDGGETWSAASAGYTGADIHTVTVDPEDPRTVFAMARCGPFVSSDAGQAWEGLFYDPAGSSDWGTIAFARLPESQSILLASDEPDGTIWRSWDAGAHWVTAFEHPAVNPVDYLAWHSFKAIAFAPSNALVIYAGMCRGTRYIDEGMREPSYGIYKSTDGGVAWRSANDSVSSRWNINCLAVDPRTDRTVYAGTVDGGVLKATDGGVSWRQMNTGLRSLDIRSIAIDPSNPSIVFAGAENGGLYKSVDGGTTWKQSSNGMDPQGTIRSVVVNPTDTQILFAGDLRTGVYRSGDAGATWVKINDGLRTRAVKALAISSDGKVLYAATEGEGVFRLDLMPAG